MMQRGKYPVLLMLLAVALLSGCGSSKAGHIYALVTGPGGADTDEMTRQAADGIAHYASEHSYEAKSYSAETESSDAYADAFKAAVDAGAKYVIAAGTAMEVPVFSAQNAYKGSRFVLLGGEPRKNDSSASSIRSNTECLLFDRKSMGFLAGYTAVKEGYTSIAWLSGRETEAGAEYYEGFLNGVGYGAVETGTGIDAVTVYTEFSGSDELSPRRMADAKSLYNEGCQLILTDRERIAEAIRMAAESLQKPYATVGFNALSSSPDIQFSAISNPEGTIRTVLTEFDEAKGFEGGTTRSCGAAESAVKLAADYSRMPVVTEVDTQTVLSAMATGRAIVSNDGGNDSYSPYGNQVHVVTREPVSGAAAVSSAAQEEAMSFVESLS